MIKKQKRSKSRFFIPLLLLLMMRYAFRVSYNAPIIFPDNTLIEIEQGDTIAKFYSHLDTYHTFMMKLWMKNHQETIPPLQKGKYALSGSYGKGDLFELISKGPQKDFTRVTLLEAWSMYDIDQALSSQGLIQPWSYIAKASDAQFIQSLGSEFSFLSSFPEAKSLEGVLYPDTYFLDQNSDIVEQLIKAQLRNFQQKVWTPYAEKITKFWHNLSAYQVLILASVIENEEKSATNKPLIAWIFLNRLEKNMRLDADVTLCYGLKITYDQCRQNIVPHLHDANNPYNTRQVFGLMPTPISSPSVETFQALLNYQQTNALYYLHDVNGQIHYAETLEEHNTNKEQYL